ncbi:MAG TPA: ATP synthase subunit I [Terriglobia bacterium]|nr:ATP synthase subunit I [Terriglobia bacterium]
MTEPLVLEKTPEPALAKAEARLPRWMALCAVGAFVAALSTGRFRFAGGFALGAALAVVAYRWLHQGIAAALGAGEGSGRVPRSMVFKLVIRYPLAFGVVYLFYETRWLSFEGVIAGLFVPVAGVLIECLFQMGGAILNRPESEGVGNGPHRV